MFKKLFGKTEEKSNNESFDVDTLLKTAWLNREQEFQHQQDNHKFRADEKKSITLGLLLNKTFDVRKQELAKLRISTNTNSYVIEDIEEIWDFDVIKPLTGFREDKSLYFNWEHLILNVSYRNYDSVREDIDKSIRKVDGCIIVHLSLAGGVNKKSVYVSATICLPPIKLERDVKNALPQAQAQTLSLLLAYDFWSSKEADAEYKFFVDSIKDKCNSQQYEALSDIEWSLVEQIHPNAGNDFYWGKRVMTEHRYLDAITYFEKVFELLQDKWLQDDLSDEEIDILYEASYLIGFCYYELDCTDKAFRYLDFAYGYKDITKYRIEYINCLVKSKDVRAIGIIETNIEQLSNKENEAWTDDEHNFYNFLFRRKAYILIDMGKLDAAEELFNILLEIDPDNDLVLSELAYISKVRRNESTTENK